MDELKNHILTIDDDEVIQFLLKKKLTAEGFEVTTVNSAEAALEHLKSHSNYDLILSDLEMPGMNGLELLSRLEKEAVGVPVVLMTAHGTMESAIEAIRKGAFDYVLKPLNMDELKFSLLRALKFTQLERDNTVLREEQRQSWKNSHIVGKSAAIQVVFEIVGRVAPTQANVLITGESGTGKELVARALHQQSPRKDGPFVAINCSAIPGELLESELFGHAKGSFTGAMQAKKGLFEEANGGTLFLDEIGDLELSLQAKLLRVLQERRIKPVGENKSREIDVRILAATHKNLRMEIQKDRFREDLYYRLCVIPIEIPPLRHRKEDIPILIDHFLRKFVVQHALKSATFSPDAISKLMAYSWPGNVREMENVIERSLILARQNPITALDLPEFETRSTSPDLLEQTASEFLSLEEVEKRYIDIILRKTGGKKERAAHILGIDRKTLRRKEKEYGILLS